MSLSLIAAVSKNGCIGKQGKTPWGFLGKPLLFKEFTLGQVVIMGRKTWDSIPERSQPLPGRTNVVVTRQTNFVLPPGVERYSTIEDAIAAHTQHDIFIIGGAEIYRQTINQAEMLYITHVDQTIEDGDTFFPEIDPLIWEQVTNVPYEGFSFATYRRRAK